MSRFILLPGAGGSGSYWDRVVPLLEQAGHNAVAVDLPGPDPRVGLAAYAEIAIGAAGPGEIVLVAGSLGGFTAPMVAARVSVSQLIFVNAMIPIPGETPGEWWGATGALQAREAAAAIGGYGPFSVETYFLHDVDTTGLRDGQAQEADAAFASVCAFDHWPTVPTRVLSGADDRFFPSAFQRRVARTRLAIETDEIPGGHLLALAQPRAVTDYLLA